MSLKDIPVMIDSGSVDDAPTGMAEALLREIADHLLTVGSGGERQVVELGNLPLSAGDLLLLEEKLGRGEVTADVSALGPTEVYETAFAGLWWVKYFNDDRHLVTQQLEIGTVPMILEAHPEDIRAGAERFNELLEVSDTQQH